MIAIHPFLLRRLSLALFGALTLFLLPSAHGGVPLNNLQGAGGIAFNPLAYTTGKPLSADSSSPATLPQAGVWHVELPDANIRWDAVGVAFTLLERLELS